LRRVERFVPIRFSLLALQPTETNRDEPAYRVKHRF
jgi:hypothetical protein